MMLVLTMFLCQSSSCCIFVACSAIKSLREGIQMYHRMSNDIDKECKALANVHLSNQEELDDIQNQLKVQL